MFKYFLPCLFLFYPFFTATADTLYYPTFKEGLERCNRSKKTYTQLFKTNRRKEKKAFLRSLEKAYSKLYGDSLSKIQAGVEIGKLTIPKIIHVIWLGSEIPEKYENWQQTWKDMKGWEYRLWTDREVETLTLANRDLYEKSNNYGEKSDILRLELLYQFGGLYVDTDLSCFNPAYFEAFHHSLDFYIGLEPLENRSMLVGTAIIGSCAQHPLLYDLIMRLPDNYHNYQGFTAVETTGPAFVTSVINDHLSSSQESSPSVSIFPPSFFYPFTRSELKARRRRPVITDKDVGKETCAIHYWDSSWTGHESHDSFTGE